jgi:starvation-inducible DNA-binding protein
MEDLVDKLKELQSNAFQMYSQSHGYHWNVEGMIFKELHAFFLEIYEDVFDSVDTIAETIRKVGAYAPFGAVQMAQYATVAINDSLSLSPKEMVSELISTNDAVITTLKDVFQLANVKYDEQGICNMIAGRIEQHQFWGWQLRATLKSVVM